MVLEVCQALESRLASALRILRQYGVHCNISPGELLAYLEGPTYEDDTVRLSDILSNDLFFLHEVAEICLLKRMGYKISRSTVMEAYPDTYYAHLEAINIELAEAREKGRYKWIEMRCRDLTSYLSDPNLPSNLEARIQKLINHYCN